MTTSLAEYRQARELWANLTLRELRSKYKRSLLGWAWSLFNPLSTMLIYTLVFRFFLRVEVPPGDPSGLHVFALYLLCGLLPWNFLSNATNGSIGTLVGNANLIKKTYFPRELLIASQVASWNVSLLIEVGILAAALLVFGNMVLPWVLPALVLLAVLTVFVTGLGLAFSALNVYFRDVQHFVGILFQAWFFLTPIVYPIRFVPDRADLFGIDVAVRALYDLNPMVGFVEAFRDLLYDLRFPPAADLAYITIVSVATFLAGLVLFNKLEPRLAEEL
ncbi:MAG: ABC transporter permease [Acidimicrobiales bacterium]